MINCTFSVTALLLISLFGQHAADSRTERPNILLILADDLGWSDLGCYGGEIRTPNLDSLARGGLRFTQFYNSARCSPTRAAILTGLHPHQAGFPNLSGVLPAHCVTIPEALQPAGYRCYMVGKWHLSRQSAPTQRGFDEFYGMLGGYNTCWKEDPFYTRLPEGHPKRAYAPDAFYSTDVFGDYALDFLEDGRKSGRPWFLYLAFNAAHFPLHAWEEDVAKYEKLYAPGWDKTREERLARQKELGLVPKDLKLTPRSDIPANQFNVKTGWTNRGNPAWDSLPADRRADLARRMAVYAAMVDRMDQAIGRVVARLKETGQFDNTVIFFLSDNGACAEWDPWGFDETSGPKNILHVGEDLKRVGGPDSYVSYGSGWANACNTPFRLYKHYGHEGGINTPLIIHWPAGLKTRAGALTREAGHITDFMPTVLELAGASYPQERDGRKVLPLEGVSLTPVIKGGPLPSRQIFMEHEGNRAVREGRWKLVALKDKPWELYDLEADPTEMDNLAAGKMNLAARLAKAWEAWADRCSVRSPSLLTQQIANKPLTITCDVEPQSRDGVILAQGGNQQGFALWLREGQLLFGVRINGTLTSIAARETLSGRFGVTARLNRDGVMQLLVSGRIMAEGPYELAFPENRGVDQRIDASLFEDSDGSVYYVWQDGMIRKLNAAMNGFDGEAQKIVPTDGQRVGYEGATLVKIGSWYVLTAAEWNGGANRSDGTYDMMYSCAKNLLGPYKPRRVAVPHAGHGALFRDKSGRWNAALFGNDRTAPFRAMPGFVPVETRDTGDDLVIRPAQDDSGEENNIASRHPDLVDKMTAELHAWQRSVERSLSGADYRQ